MRRETEERSELGSEYLIRRGRHHVLSTALVILLVVVGGDFLSSGFGAELARGGLVFIAIIIGVLAWDNWRCPHCGKSLGQRWNPVWCPTCSTQLRRWEAGGQRERNEERLRGLGWTALGLLGGVGQPLFLLFGRPAYLVWTGVTAWVAGVAWEGTKVAAKRGTIAWGLGIGIAALLTAIALAASFRQGLPQLPDLAVFSASWFLGCGLADGLFLLRPMPRQGIVESQAACTGFWHSAAVFRARVCPSCGGREGKRSEGSFVSSLMLNELHDLLKEVRGTLSGRRR